MTQEVSGSRLLVVCESFCEALRRNVGLTSFRIELRRTGTPLVVSLRGGGDVQAVVKPHGLGGPAARLEVTLRHRGHVLALLQIEDERRARYPDDASQRCEDVGARYVPELAAVIAEGAA